MKRILSWLYHLGSNRSESPISRPVSTISEEIQEGCMSYNAQITGIDHVLRHSYRYDTYYVS